MSQTSPPAAENRVVCPAARDPAVRLFIVAGMLIIFGAWCAYDSFIADKYPYPDDGNINDVAKFYFNRGGGIVLPIAGAVPLIWALVCLKRKLVADAAGIGYEGKPPIPWHSVTGLDASLLQEKGILKVNHAGEEPLVLDSWKLTNFKALVAFVEARVGRADAEPEPASAHPGEPDPVDDDASDSDAGASGGD